MADDDSRRTPIGVDEQGERTSVGVDEHGDPLFVERRNPTTRERHFLHALEHISAAVQTNTEAQQILVRELESYPDRREVEERLAILETVESHRRRTNIVMLMVPLLVLVVLTVVVLRQNARLGEVVDGSAAVADAAAEPSNENMETLQRLESALAPGGEIAAPLAGVLVERAEAVAERAEAVGLAIVNDARRERGEPPLTREEFRSLFLDEEDG